MERDYPRIYDANTFLNNYSLVELEERIQDLAGFQLEWVHAACTDEEKLKLINAEMESRDLSEDVTFHETQKQQPQAEDTGAEVWDSGLDIIENPQIIVPEKVRRICTAIQREMPGTEFGILFKGEWTGNGFKVKPDYVIPEQTVTSAHITYDEDLKKYRDRGYIVNTHSHPRSGYNSGFSGTDDEHINSHFEIALLYGGGAEDIVNARANVEVENGTLLQIEPDVVRRQPKTEQVYEDEVEELKEKAETMNDERLVEMLEIVQSEKPELPDVDLDNIEKETASTRRYTYNGNWNGRFKYGGEDEEDSRAGHPHRHR